MDLEIRVERRLTGTGKKIMKQLADVQDSFVSMGIPYNVGRKKVVRPAGSKSKLNVAQLAYMNEFGYIKEVKVKKPIYFRLHNGKHAQINKGGVLRIPARPFLRALYQKKSMLDRLRMAVVGAFASMLRGNLTVKQCYSSIGEAGVYLIKNEILTMKQPSNAELTIMIKGFNDPLVRTKKNLHDNITYKVNKVSSLRSKLKTLEEKGIRKGDIYRIQNTLAKYKMTKI